jgi:hypothetical protein
MTRSGKKGPTAPASQAGGMRGQGTGAARPAASREVFGRFVSTLSRLEGGKAGAQPGKGGRR